MHMLQTIRMLSFNLNYQLNIRFFPNHSKDI